MEFHAICVIANRLAEKRAFCADMFFLKNYNIDLDIYS